MTFRTKLIGSFGIILILLVGALGIYHYAMTAMKNDFEHLLYVETTLAAHAASVEALTLQAHRTAKDFLLYKDKQYVEQHQTTMTELLSEAQAMGELAEQAGYGKEIQRVSHITTMAQEYARSFEELVAAWEKRGLSHTTGLQGKFRRIVHLVMGDLAQYEVEDLYLALLRMLQAERDYRLAPTERTQQQVLIQIETYQQLLEGSQAEIGAKQMQETALKVYQEAFRSYVTAVAPEEQLQYAEQIQRAAHTMENALQEVYVPHVGVLVLQIRQHEKNYLLRGLEEYVAATHQAITTLLDAFGNAGVSDHHYQNLAINLQVYQETFDQLVTEDQRINVLDVQMRQVVEQIEVLANELKQHTREAAISMTMSSLVKANSLSRMAIGIGMAAIILGLLFSLKTVRDIQKQLGADPAVVAALARRVAEGDLTIQSEMKKAPTRGLFADVYQMAIKIRNILHQTENLTQAIQQGKWAKRGSTETLTGSWRELMLGINNVVEAFATPMTRVTAALAHIANGDLTYRITDEYPGDFNRIKESLTTMIHTLRTVAMNLRTASDLVASGSQDLSAHAAQLSEGTSEQAATAEELSATMEQMTANIRQNAENARLTENLALQAARDAQEGGAAVAEAVAAMQKIAQKVSIIKEIARQTHLLSLNATIEAVKAEEHGKGFAVVAAEVRALAGRSRVAAEDITELVTSNLTIVEAAGALLNEFVPVIRNTAQLVQEISAASGEQHLAAEQMNTSIQQLDHVIQHNAASSEELASTAEELAAQAEQLQQTMAFFQTSTARLTLA